MAAGQTVNLSVVMGAAEFDSQGWDLVNKKEKSNETKTKTALSFRFCLITARDTASKKRRDLLLSRATCLK